MSGAWYIKHPESSSGSFDGHVGAALLNLIATVGYQERAPNCGDLCITDMFLFLYCALHTLHCPSRESDLVYSLQRSPLLNENLPDEA